MSLFGKTGFEKKPTSTTNLYMVSQGVLVQYS
jgi:hypothetical protein